MKREKYSKYLFYWQGRYQASKWHSRVSFIEEWVIHVTHNTDLRTNPFQEEGNNVIQASTSSNTKIQEQGQDWNSTIQVFV